MFKKIISIFIAVFFSNFLFSQNPLPDFLIEKNNKGENVISWRNPFSTSLIQITIQRSADSVRNFRSIYTSEKPGEPSGNYIDIPNGKFYYRLFYMLKDGSYFNSAVKTVPSGFETLGLMSYLNNYENINVSYGGRITSYNKANFLKLKDSVLNNTADSLKYVSANTVNYIYYAPVFENGRSSISGYKFISNYLYLNEDGNPVIKLPINDYYKYSMIIYNRDGKTVLYKINSFDSNELILSNASFVYPGMYPYELKYNDQIRDKNNIEIR